MLKLPTAPLQKSLGPGIDHSIWMKYLNTEQMKITSFKLFACFGKHLPSPIQS